MGVLCQIHLERPPDGLYRPGDLVSGTVKYVIDKETAYKGITLSLIGKGKCSWSESRTDGKSDDTYYGREDLVTIHTHLLDTKLDVVNLQPGEYIHPFQFVLPINIPPSYSDHYSSILYRVIIKFERPGLFNFNEKFETACLPVVSTVICTLPEPIIYGEQKSLFQLLTTKKSIINLKVNMHRSLVASGENASLDLEVTNDSNVTIPCVKMELNEVITYTAKCGRMKKRYAKVKDCKGKFGSIAAGETKTIDCVVPTLPDIVTIHHSKVVSREYKLRVTVKLPIPHTNLTLDIPLVIGDKELPVEVAEEAAAYCGTEEAPPSYWEAMAEGKEYKS